jgi:hypothetical protein
MRTGTLFPDTIPSHDPGGKSRIPFPPDFDVRVIWGGATREYRYALELIWDTKLPLVLFIMMNPSTANERYADSTVNRCISWAKANGYGGVLVGNTFGYRVTDKRRLLEIKDPIGPENDACVIAMAERAQLVVFAYGQPHRKLRGRGPELARKVCAAIGRLVHVLRLAKNGIPWHPLYLRCDTKPLVWTVAA